MPTFRAEVGPEGKPVVRATLHVKGRWPDDLNETQKAAWNKATHAINELCDLYADDLATPAPPYPPNTMCCCGELIHPDQPNVVLQPDGKLFHWNDEGGGHSFDADIEYPT